MRGNDVIDLDLASRESNWQRRGFLEKVFVGSEQGLILNDDDPSGMVWLLWSMKEAAYKAHQRRFSLTPWLNWKSLTCTLTQRSTSAACGTVAVHGYSYTTCSAIFPDHIHSVADTSDQLPGGKDMVLRTPSIILKQELLRYLAVKAGVSARSLSLKKSSLGIPEITLKGKVFFTGFSLSDHGRFAAFSCR